jgi:uncharacterized membrane protein YbhN (UPF0104 family)
MSETATVEAVGQRMETAEPTRLDPPPPQAQPVTSPWAKKARALRRKRLFQRIGTVASIVLFCVAVAVLTYIIRELDFDKVKAAYTATSWRQIAMALGLAALSYLMLTGYDALALKQVHPEPVRYSLTALASFTSFAVSFTLGFPLLTAATVRFWVYSAIGLGAGAIASLTLIAGLTFWLGMSLVLGGVMVWQPVATASFTRLAPDMNTYIGAAILSAVAAYIVWIAIRPRALTMQGWTFHLPRLHISLAQIALGALDVCVSCGVLYVLLPEGHGVPFATVIAAYVFANLLGIASHAPGGIGVFEATIMVALWQIPREALLGSVLLYRCCYYLLPFIVAIFLLGLREILLRARKMQKDLGVEEE